jgi:Ca2+-transporting ATPase
MARPPRPVGAPVLSRGDWVRLSIQGAVMTVGALVAYQIGDGQDGAVVGATMLLTTLSLFHVVAGLLSRDQRSTIFNRDSIPGAAQLRRYGVSLVAIVAITAFDILERIFDTTGLTFDQWLICTGLALTLLVVEEVVKVFVRRRQPSVPAGAAVPAHTT